MHNNEYGERYTSIHNTVSCSYWMDDISVSDICKTVGVHYYVIHCQVPPRIMMSAGKLNVDLIPNLNCHSWIRFLLHIIKMI